MELAEIITWEKFIPAVQKKDPALSIETFCIHLQDINYEEHKTMPVAQQKVAHSFNPANWDHVITPKSLGTWLHLKINEEMIFNGFDVG